MQTCFPLTLTHIHGVLFVISIAHSHTWPKALHLVKTAARLTVAVPSFDPRDHLAGRSSPGKAGGPTRYLSLELSMAKRVESRLFEMASGTSAGRLQARVVDTMQVALPPGSMDIYRTDDDILSRDHRFYPLSRFEMYLRTE